MLSLDSDVQMFEGEVKHMGVETPDKNNRRQSLLNIDVEVDADAPRRVMTL